MTLLDFLNKSDWKWEEFGILDMVEIPETHGSRCHDCHASVGQVACLVFTKDEDDLEYLRSVMVSAMGYTEIRYINQPCGHVARTFSVELLTPPGPTGDAGGPPGEEDHGSGG